MKIGDEYLSVFSAQVPKLFRMSRTMFFTMAAEFGASGTFDGSGLFHGPDAEKPLWGRVTEVSGAAEARPAEWAWLTVAGAQPVSAKAVANAIPP